MTKIKIFASDNPEKLVSDLNDFIEKEVDCIVDIRYESFPVSKRYNSSGIPTVVSILDRVLIMYEPKQEDPEDDDCEFCSFGEMLDSLKSVFNAKKEKESEEYSDDNKKPSRLKFLLTEYNPVEKAYFLVKDLNERVSSSMDTIDGRYDSWLLSPLEEILGYLGEALA